MPQDPPPKPFGHPRPVDLRSSAMPEGDREVIMTRLAEVDRRWGAKFDEFAGRTDHRLTALEKAALSERETALAVERLTLSVEKSNALLTAEREANRAQDMDIGALKAALRPSVEAAASAEGQLAGGAAGKRSARVVSLVGAVLTALLCGVLQHCEQQLANYQNGTATAASAKP